MGHDGCALLETFPGRCMPGACVIGSGPLENSWAGEEGPRVALSLSTNLGMMASPGKSVRIEGVRYKRLANSGAKTGD